VVSRAIFSHLQKTSDDPAHAKVYLDLRPIEPDRLRYRFPNIIRICQKWGINVFEDVIPVAPAAHYWMGGVATDLNARTSLPGLYAIGEAASTGVHGANRLASNSLLECIVFAANLVEIGLEPENLVGERPEKPLEIAENWQEEQEYWQKVRRELPILMWENAGICRFQNELETAILRVQQWKQQLQSLKMGQFLQNLLPDKGQLFLCPSVQLEIRIAIETLNLLDIADLILESALLRAESRGGHYRGDYPETVANWQFHTTIQGRTWRKTPVQA
jgi:L-aspartate oxidase